VGDGVSAVDRVTEAPKSVLNQKPLSIGPTDINLLARADSCYQKLKRKEQELRTRPLPSKAQMAAAWSSVVKAYWVWAKLAGEATHRQDQIEDMQAKQRKRLIVLRESATRRMVHKIRLKLGPRFASLPSSSREKLRVLTARVPLSTLEAISPSPPSPSE
jgi:hypothetical protein